MNTDTIACIIDCKSSISFAICRSNTKTYFGVAEAAPEALEKLSKFISTFHAFTVLLADTEKYISESIINEILKLLPSTQAVYLPAKAFKMQLLLQNIHKSTLISLNSKVDLESVNICRPIAGCWNYLIEQNIDIEGMSLEMVVVGELMILEAKSYKDLNIFTETIHPSFIKGKGRSKEGLSVLTMLNYTVTSVGYSTLKDYLLFPTTNPQMINERLDRINEMMDFIKMNNSALKSLKKVSELKSQISHFEIREYTHLDFLQLYKSLSNGIEYCDKILNHMKEHSPNSPFIEEIEALHIDKLAELCSQISNIVDIPFTKKTRTLKICKGVVKLYDEFERQSQELMNTSNALTQYPHHITQLCKIMFNPIFHFCIYYTNPSEQLAVIPEEWVKAWECTKFTIFETEDLQELNDMLVPIYYESKVEIDEAFNKLIENHIISNKKLIYHLIQYIGLLDAFSSLACASQALNLVRPIISEDRTTEIIGGRHIIGERIFKSFTSNSITISKGATIITGPNSSGKTVLIKEIAVIIYLAHLGCFVPCESAKIALYSKMLCLFPDRESSSLGLSYYIKQLVKLNRIISSIEENTIIFMDEFQTGTNQAEGNALYAAIIEMLTNPKMFKDVALQAKLSHVNAPAILSTLNSLCKIPDAKYYRMGVNWTGEKLVCTYKLEEGECSGYDIIKYSKMIGIYSLVIIRAEYVKSCIGSVLKPLVMFTNWILKLGIDMITRKLSQSNSVK